jgi:hypothetical protein
MAVQVPAQAPSLLVFFREHRISNSKGGVLVHFMLLLGELCGRLCFNIWSRSKDGPLVTQNDGEDDCEGPVDALDETVAGEVAKKSESNVNEDMPNKPSNPGRKDLYDINSNHKHQNYSRSLG